MNINYCGQSECEFQSEPVCAGEAQSPTRVWQKWRFSAPQSHLWLIKVWFSAYIFVAARQPTSNL